MGKNYVCGVLMMRQEGKILERLLSSIKPIVDGMYFLDTGSTDDSMEVAARWCSGNKVRFVIEELPWEDDFRRRNDALQGAIRCFPEATHFLLTDGDSQWELHPSFSKDKLPDCGLVRHQYNNGDIDDKIHVLSRKYEWECFLPTHEFWGPPIGLNKPEPPRTFIRQLFVRDKEDGGSRGDKYERDKRVLLKYLSNPEEKRTREHEERAKTYLASTLIRLGEHEEAIRYAREAVAVRGWNEPLARRHIVNAHFEMALRDLQEASNEDRQDEAGQLLASGLDSFAKGVRHALLATTRFPDRMEYLEILNINLVKVQCWEHVYVVCKIAKDVKVPASGSMISCASYRVPFYRDLSVSCWNLGLYEEGKEACLKMVREKWLPELAKRNLAHFK